MVTKKKQKGEGMMSVSFLPGFSVLKICLVDSNVDAAAGWLSGWRKKLKIIKSIANF